MCGMNKAKEWLNTYCGEDSTHEVKWADEDMLKAFKAGGESREQTLLNALAAIKAHYELALKGKAEMSTVYQIAARAMRQ